MKPREGMPVSTTPFFLSSPVGSFEASEIRFYCDHTIAIHLQSTEDMFILLIAKPVNQEVNKVQDHWSHLHGRRKRESTHVRGENRGCDENYGKTLSSENR